jgi:hypothetical protein
MTVLEKTGFRVKDPFSPIIIRDMRGIMFYNTLALTPKVKHFNLPKGDYLVDNGYFTKMDKPVNYPLYPLPKFERKRKKPYDFKIIFGNNPNKCTVYWYKKLIVFDNALKELPKPQLDFILFHEYAHARYTTEVYCDLMAANYMLTRGYNPSQIRVAPIKTLSDKQIKRKIEFVKLTSLKP